MAKSRLRLKELNLDEKEMKCAALEYAYTEHVAVFTEGATRKVDVAAVRTALHNKRVEIEAAEAALALHHEQRERSFRGLEIITMSGLELQEDPAPRPVPGKVLNVQTSSGDDDGQGEVQWDTMRDVADDFEIQPATSADGPFNHYDVVKKSKVTLTGMTSGAKLYVRVRARNAAGKGPWSDIASVRIT